MLATIFLSAFVVIPLGMTVIQAFRRHASVAPDPEPAPRWSMRDFKPREHR